MSPSAERVSARPAGRDGIALVLALLAIAVIGALIAGAFFASTQEFRVGRNSLAQTRAFVNAEAGLNDVYANWDNSLNAAMKTGDTRTYLKPDGSADPTARVVVTRTGDLSYWLVSHGSAAFAARTQSSRRTGLLLRIVIPELSIRAALTSRGAISITGDAAVVGVDTDPAGWDCPPGGRDMAGVAVAALSDVNGVGAAAIRGDPPVTADTGVADTSTYSNFGEHDWNAMAASADIRLIGGDMSPAPNLTATLPARCNTRDAQNWGDTARREAGGPCEHHFPLIYSEGDLHLTGGAGQGVLLVNGDLELSAPFAFFGPIIVRGSVRSTGPGVRVHGALMMAQLNSLQRSALDGAIITYSSCALQHALRASTRPTPVAQRAWADLLE